MPSLQQVCTRKFMCTFLVGNACSRNRAKSMMESAGCWGVVNFREAFWLRTQSLNNCWFALSLLRTPFKSLLWQLSKATTSVSPRMEALYCKKRKTTKNNFSMLRNRKKKTYFRGCSRRKTLSLRWDETASDLRF